MNEETTLCFALSAYAALSLTKLASYSYLLIGLRQLYILTGIAFVVLTHIHIDTICSVRHFLFSTQNLDRSTSVPKSNDEFRR